MGGGIVIFGTFFVGPPILLEPPHTNIFGGKCDPPILLTQLNIVYHTQTGDKCAKYADPNIE